ETMISAFENRTSAFELPSSPDNGRKFTELYNVQHLQTAQLDRVSRVCISTIQRLYSVLRSLFFWLNKRRHQGRIMLGDRPGGVRVQRSMWTALSNAFRWSARMLPQARPS